MERYPPSFLSTIFNDAAFQDFGYLTKREADGLYISSNWFNTTPGTSQPMKIMITDSNNSISGINSIGMTSIVLNGTLITSTGIEINYLHGSTPGTASASNALVVDSGRNIININNIGVSTISIGALSIDSTDLSYIDGITPGTAAASKAVVLDSSRNITNMNNISSTGILTMSNTNDSILISNSSTSGRSNVKYVNDLSDYFEHGIRGSTAGNPRTHYWYSNGSYKFLMALPTGDSQFLSTTQTSSYSTGALQVSGGLAVSKLVYCDSVKINATTASTNATTGALVCAGGFGLSGNMWSTGSITLNFGFLDRVQTIFLSSSVSSSGLISYEPTGKTTYFQSGNNAGIYGYMSLNSNGVFINPSNFNPAGTCNSNSLIDFGSCSKNFQINLFNGEYGISANNNAVNIMSGGVSGVFIGGGSSYALSRYDAQITPAGSIQCYGGVRACGFSTVSYAGWAGNGVEMHYAAGRGDVFAYNRSSLLYKPLSLNNTIHISDLGLTGVGVSYGSFILEVGTNNQNVSSYGYLNSAGGTGTSASSGIVAFSIKTYGRIACASEIDCYSDARIKSHIRPITRYEAETFVKQVIPRWYIYRETTANDRQFGYVAQNIASVAQKSEKAKALDDLITAIDEKGLEEHISDDGFVSPKDVLLMLNYQKVIPILHRFILIQEERINEQAEEIERLRADIDEILSRPPMKHFDSDQVEKNTEELRLLRRAVSRRKKPLDSM